MKKQIVISSFIAAAILGSTAILSVAKAESPKDEAPKLLAANSAISTPKPIINSTKTETVYVLTDENGNEKSKFIGSTIYTGAEELPFNIKATYYLDGAEISPKELAGKSGHIKIVFNYNSTATYNGRFIPFLALTTINLDHAKFSNIKLENGKIFNENNTTYTIIGYTLTGMNKNLGTSFLPDTFVLEADTTNFELADTYTIFTNDVLTDIDLPELSRLDQLTNSIYQLEDAMNKLVAGASELSEGLAKALDGIKTLYEGSKTLATGTKDALNSSNELSSGLNFLASKNQALQAGATSIITSTIGNLAEKGINVTVQNYKTILGTTINNLKAALPTMPEGSEPYNNAVANITELTKAESLLDFATGVIGYTNGVAEAATGATNLSAGLDKLSTGATTISNGLGSLVEGGTKLYNGSVTLKDGLITFKTSGIDKLVSFASKDLTNFTNNLRGTINAANSYKSFGDVDARSVKFIVKTPSI